MLTLPINPREVFTATFLALISSAGPGIYILLGVVQGGVPGKQERDTSLVLGFDGDRLVCKASIHHVGAQTNPEKNPETPSFFYQCQDR